MGPERRRLLYLVTIICFVLALRCCHPRRRRNAGTRSARWGWAIAIVATLLKTDVHVDVADGRAGAAIGSRSKRLRARRVKMAAMPQMVALFNGVGGGAAALVALAEFHELAPAPGRIRGDVSVAILLSALIGSISFSGSLVAFAKLQELIQGRPIVYPGQKIVNAAVLLLCLAAGAAILAGAEQGWLLGALVGGALALRRHVRAADRRRGHAGRDLAAERAHRSRRRGDRFELSNNVLIVSGMLVGASGTLLTMLMGRAMNRSIANVALRCVRADLGRCGVRRDDGRHRPADNRRRRRGDARLREQGGRRPGLRDGRRPGAARRARARGHSRGARHRRKVRDPPGRGPHARPHERAARRSEHPVHATEGDGRGEQRVRAHGRRARDRGQRRRQPRCALECRQPDLRHADPECRPGAGGRRAQALDEPRVRRHRQPALPRPEDRDAVRRREGVGRRSSPPASRTV